MVMQVRNKAMERTMRLVVLRPEIEVSEETDPRDAELARVPGYWKFRRCPA